MIIIYCHFQNSDSPNLKNRKSQVGPRVPGILNPVIKKSAKEAEMADTKLKLDIENMEVRYS